jgi:site-specific DNA recombinase
MFKRKTPALVSEVLGRASSLADRCASGSCAGHLEIINALVRRVTIAQDEVAIEIDHNGLAERLLDRKAPPREKDCSPVSIEVPVTFRRRGVEAKLVVLHQQEGASEPDANLCKALARAHDWWGRIACGEAKGIGDMARAESFNRAYVTRFLCLAFLAPEITKAILEGRQPAELTAKRLISSALNSPLLWPDQMDIFRS